MDKNELKKVSPFELGDINPVAQYFTGTTYLASLTSPSAQTDISNVTFAPGCINNWHVHHGCQQIIVCVGGEGWYQEEGKEPQELKEGTVIVIPANVKHWHGAKKDSWFSHIAVEIPGENASSEWCEPVSDTLYEALY